MTELPTTAGHPLTEHRASKHQSRESRCRSPDVPARHWAVDWRWKQGWRRLPSAGAARAAGHLQEPAPAGLSAPSAAKPMPSEGAYDSADARCVLRKLLRSQGMMSPTVQNFSNSFIVRTGHVREIAFLVFGGSLFGLISLSTPAGLHRIPLVAALVTYVWVPATTRCPKCRSRYLWRAMREKPVSRWLRETILADRCPQCDPEP